MCDGAITITPARCSGWNREVGDSVRIENTITINRPIETVFAYVTNVANTPRYASTVIEAQQLSPGPPVEGTTLRMVGKFLGKKLDTTYRVSAYEPHHVFAYKSIGGPVPQSWRATFEPAPGGTRCTVVVEADAAGVVRLATSALAGMIKRQGDADLSTLKRLLESE